MRYPNKVTIFGNDYEVILNSRTIKDHDADGYCDHEMKKIYVDKSLKGSRQLQTFLHEGFHGVLHRTGITQGIDSGIEEAIVESLSTWITEVFHMRFKDV